MKILLFPLLLAFSCALAALYGALHNQISYSVSPGYFHDFKFIQFRIDQVLHNRWGAAQVGIFASWWMGIVIGLPIYLFALRIKDIGLVLKTYITAAALVAVITLSVGLAGLILSTHIIDAEDLLAISPQRPTSDPLAFARAGAMHDFSYIGGITGLLIALIFTRRCARKSRHN